MAEGHGHPLVINKEKENQGENNARKNQGNKNLKTPQKEILRKAMNYIYIYIYIYI